MKTFLFQGDSITDANRVDENDENFGLGCGYALLTASDLGKNRPGEFKFINRGVSGDRITDVYARIKEDIINLKPDYMSILIGVNDVSHELTGDFGVTPDKFLKIYRMLIEEIKEALPNIEIIILEPFILKGSATEALWNDFDYYVRKHAKIAKQIAEEFDLKFVPLQNKFDEVSIAVGARYWSVDGIHPTAPGHQIIKDELHKAIEEILS